MLKLKHLCHYLLLIISLSMAQICASFDTLKPYAAYLCHNTLKRHFTLAIQKNGGPMTADLFEYDDIYMSGSVVAACVAQARKLAWQKVPLAKLQQSVDTNIFGDYGVNDVDLYSTNKMRLLHKFPWLLDLNKSDLVNVCFDTIEEILDTYDTTMVQCAYHLKTNQLVGYSQQYAEVMILQDPVFVLHRLNTSTNRYGKLVRRAEKWFGGTIDFRAIKALQIQDSCSSNRSNNSILPVAGCFSIKQWYGNRQCVGCHGVFLCCFHKAFAYHAFVCNGCYTKASMVLRSSIEADRSLKGKNFLIIGGASGIGQVLVKELCQLGASVTATSRRPLCMVAGKDSAVHYVKYTIENMSEEAEASLKTAICSADVIVFSAWPTVEGDLNNWRHNLEDFPQDVFVERTKVVLGYVRFLKTMAAAVRNAQTSGLPGAAKQRAFIMMDADETKYCRGKIMTGRHLMCNMIKACQKMATGTIAEQLGFLNVRVSFYDPGWLSISWPASVAFLTDDTHEMKVKTSIESYIANKTLMTCPTDRSRFPNTTALAVQCAGLEQFFCSQAKNTQLSMQCLLYSSVGAWAGTDDMLWVKKRGGARINTPMFVTVGQEHSYYHTMESILSRTAAITENNLGKHIARSPRWISNAIPEIHERWYKA